MSSSSYALLPRSDSSLDFTMHDPDSQNSPMEEDNKSSSELPTFHDEQQLELSWLSRLRSRCFSYLSLHFNLAKNENVKM